MTLLGWKQGSHLWAPNLLWEYPTHRYENTLTCGRSEIIRATGCRQAQAYIGEEQINRWTTGLLRLSRWEAYTLVDPITGHNKVNYHRRRLEGLLT